MIEQVIVKNSYGEELILSLREPDKRGYVISNISGLEPPQIDEKTQQLASGNRFVYNMGFNKIRTIKLTFLFYLYNDLHMDVQELRDWLYNYMKPRDEVKLKIVTDRRTYAIMGRVGTHTSTYFSKDCGAEVSVTCPELWFFENDIRFRKNSVIAPADQGKSYVGAIGYQGNIQNGIQVVLNESSHTDTESNTVIYDKIPSGKFIVETTHNDLKKRMLFNIPRDSAESLTISTESDKIIATYTKHDANGDKIERSALAWLDVSDKNYMTEFPAINNGHNDIFIGFDSNNNDGNDLSSFNPQVKYATVYMGV